MKSQFKLFLTFILCITLPLISYADKSKYCPEGKNISSSQGFRRILVYGYNFEGKYFYARYRVGINPNDAPSIWYDNFRFIEHYYSMGTLSCAYRATHHVYGEPPEETTVIISNTGSY